MTLVTGTFFYHQYFSFLTLLMFNSIDFSLPPKPSALPPYIENPAIAHASQFSVTLLIFSLADYSISQVLTTFYVVLSPTIY